MCRLLSVAGLLVSPMTPGTGPAIKRHIIIASDCIQPTIAETAAMLAELDATIGQDGTRAMTSLRPLALDYMRRGKHPLSPAIRRSIWGAWQATCRPGAIATVFDWATWGRFTERGGPSTAGKQGHKTK